LLVSAYDAERRGGTALYLIDANTGAVTPPIVETPADDPAWAAAWSRDGSRLYYSRLAIYGGASRVIARELATGNEREVYRGRAYALTASPDGRHLALITVPDSATRTRLVILRLDGGEPRELVSDPGIDWHMGLAWVPDGSGLLYGKIVRRPSDSMGEVWHVSATDGSIRKTALTVEEGPVDLKLHPDGRRVVFSAGSPDAWEVWVMENLLPRVSG
jgi:Tol biopolymer transport system component